MKLWLPLCFLPALLLGLLIEAPAGKLLPHLLPESAPLRLYEIDGRLIDSRIGYVDTGRVAIEDLQLRLQAAPLLLGRLAAEVEAKPADAWAQGRISTGLAGQLRVDGLRATARLEDLKPVLNLPFLPVQGQLSAEIERLEFEGRALRHASGVLRLGNTVWSLSRPPAELGLFSAELKTVEDGIVAQLADQEAKLALSGELRLAPDQSYVVDLRLRPKADTPAPVANNLRTLGRTDSDGWYRVQQRGQLPGS